MHERALHVRCPLDPRTGAADGLLQVRAQLGGERVEKSAHVRRPLVLRSLAWLAYGAMRFALFATRHRY